MPAENTRILGNHDREITNTARIGVISEVQGNHARVSIGKLTTDLIPWVSRRAAADFDWWQPAIGEQVVVLSLWGDPSQGVIIGSIEQDDHPAPASGTTWGKRFRDGTTLTYNPDTHALDVQAGDSPITITAASATLAIPSVHCTGTITVDGDVVAGGISLRGHTHGGVKAGGDSTSGPK